MWVTQVRTMIFENYAYECRIQKCIFPGRSVAENSPDPRIFKLVVVLAVICKSPRNKSHVFILLKPSEEHLLTPTLE